ALLGLGLALPAAAQSASEMALRMQQLEEQVRQLMGQVERLDYEVKQLRAQSKSGALEPMPEVPSTQKKIAAASVVPLDDGGIESVPLAPSIEDNATVGLEKAPGPTVLGSLNNSAAQPNDGGFQGKVLVPPSQQEPGDDDFISQGLTQESPGIDPDAIETVSLSPEAPEALYERSNESLLRRQFGDAEAGFSTFVSKYPDHGLAGSAQYWLGETYYAQSDYKRAAQAFLRGYKTYPKSRRAADSLLKLGISLNRLGQGQQACAAYASVSSEYPKAVEARKRAQAEAKRAGCSS
ncbi:MAG: tol-pal system protein YbgF, partial [Novosphingobium sp.]|nr:tol-pal system protein YbgF [Novosphingobium sp.]